jgi:hypothetical protein
MEDAFFGSETFSGRKKSHDFSKERIELIYLSGTRGA